MRLTAPSSERPEDTKQPTAMAQPYGSWANRGLPRCPRVPASRITSSMPSTRLLPLLAALALRAEGRDDEPVGAADASGRLARDADAGLRRAGAPVDVQGLRDRDRRVVDDDVAAGDA